MNTNYKIPASLKKKILSGLVPIHYLKYTLVCIFLLTFSPFLILIIEPNRGNITQIMNYIIATISVSLILESILLGIIVFQTKNPYMSELKEKLGYIE